MAIPDVHAIPETADACTEYQTEADHAWDSGDADHAWDVYRSLFESHAKSDTQKSHVAHRLALIAVNRGQTDVAWSYIGYSNGPGADDIKHSLDNATPNDRTPDPDVVPTTVEQTGDWWTAARTALEAALHLDGHDEVKGRAQYYLGAMTYQEKKYAEARYHVEAAASSARDPERGWATDMLTWHYDETVGI